MKARFLEPAAREFQEATEHYSNQHVGLGDEFRDEVYAAIERIKSFPSA